MNASASPPSPDPGFSVEPPPLPEFDCTVDLDLDPAPRGLHRVLRYFKPPSRHAGPRRARIPRGVRGGRGVWLPRWGSWRAKRA